MSDTVVRCTRCRRERQPCEMKRDPRYTTGLSSYCKQCHQAASVAWQKGNPERLNKTRRARYAAKKNQLNAARRAQYKPDQARASRRAYLYRIDETWFAKTLAAQGGGCAICGEQPSGDRRDLHVDHDHSCCARTPTCGACNRGILCHACNTALHAVEAKPGWLAGALAYLQRTTHHER